MTSKLADENDFDHYFNAARRLTAERDELRAILDSHRVWISDAQLPVWVCEAEVERHERRFRETEAEWVARFQALEAEIERLREHEAQLEHDRDALSKLFADADVARSRLRTALEGVIAEADRKTAAFDRAHAALARHKE